MQKVNISIPKTRRIVYNLAKNVGFKDEGVNRMSFTKNGKTHDQWLLGLTRKEIRGML
jgi:RimJ/RimL family protein N-acetyltransferase